MRERTRHNSSKRGLWILPVLLLMSSISAQDYNLTVVTDESQRHGSHLTDYLLNILDESNLKYEKKIYPWARALNLAETKKMFLSMAWPGPRHVKINLSGFMKRPSFGFISMV